MEELEKIVQKWCPIYEKSSDKKIFSDGLLDSLGYVAIITDIEEAYQIEIPIEKVTPENFDTLESIYALVQELRGE